MAAGPCDLSTSSALPLRKAWVPHSAARGSASAIAASFNSDSESAYVRQPTDPAEAPPLDVAHTLTPQSLGLPLAFAQCQSNTSASLAGLRRGTGRRARAPPPPGPAAAGDASSNVDTAEWPLPFKPTTSAPNLKQNCL